MSYRAKLCQALGITSQVDEGLHGSLSHSLAERLMDPDMPARTWVLNSAAPIGIEREILPAGAFPKLQEREQEKHLDSWYTGVNYSSFEEHREGAETLLKKERETLVGCSGTQRAQPWSTSADGRLP